jgi:hypothetical protein
VASETLILPFSRRIKYTMEEIIKLTKDLIRFRSMHSEPEEIKRCAEFGRHPFF